MRAALLTGFSITTIPSTSRQTTGFAGHELAAIKSDGLEAWPSDPLSGAAARGGGSGGGGGGESACEQSEARWGGGDDDGDDMRAERGAAARRRRRAREASDARRERERG